jgi:hypothetical protein
MHTPSTPVYWLSQPIVFMYITTYQESSVLMRKRESIATGTEPSSILILNE